MDNGGVITKKNYRKGTIFIYNNEVIKPSYFTELIYANKILNVATTKEIIYIDEGNIYKLINNNNNELYLECDNSISLKLPNNLILADNKLLVKTKKSGNIY